MPPISLFIGQQHPLSVERSAGTEETTDKPTEGLLTRADVSVKSAQKDAGRFTVVTKFPKDKTEVLDEVTGEIVFSGAQCGESIAIFSHSSD
jgi:hypothetical protein